jgi:hypothetical protein
MPRPRDGWLERVGKSWAAKAGRQKLDGESQPRMRGGRLGWSSWHLMWTCSSGRAWS